MSFFNNLNNIKYEPTEDLRFFDRCYVCGNKSDELFKCQRCDELYCDNCHASYNQFTQIDYNCCRSCGESIENREIFD